MVRGLSSNTIADEGEEDKWCFVGSLTNNMYLRFIARVKYTFTGKKSMTHHFNFCQNSDFFIYFVRNGGF